MITLEAQRAFVHIVPDVAYAIKEAVVRLLYRGIYRGGSGEKVLRNVVCRLFARMGEPAGSRAALSVTTALGHYRDE